MSTWQLIETAPKSTTILVFYKNCFGNGRIVKARYVEKDTEESDGEYSDNAEYNEEKDMYFTPEGWYELIDNWPDYSSCHIHEGEPTHWMPLPEFPC